MSKPSAPSIGYHFTLFVGAPPGSGKLRVTDRFGVYQRLANRFSGFFIHDGQGFFKGGQEDSLKVEIVTTEPMAVLEVAEEIREALHLEAVGVSWAGIYQRILSDSDLEDIHGKWRLPDLEQGGA